MEKLAAEKSQILQQHQNTLDSIRAEYEEAIDAVRSEKRSLEIQYDELRSRYLAVSNSSANSDSLASERSRNISELTEQLSSARREADSLQRYVFCSSLFSLSLSFCFSLPSDSPRYNVTDDPFFDGIDLYLF